MKHGYVIAAALAVASAPALSQSPIPLHAGSAAGPAASPWVQPSPEMAPAQIPAYPAATPPSYVWEAGHWRWDGYQYVWQPGRYAAWTESRWDYPGAGSSLPPPGYPAAR